MEKGKDEYTFDFAELSLEYSEHELEMRFNVNNDNPHAKRLYEKLGCVAVETDNWAKTKMRVEL